MNARAMIDLKALWVIAVLAIALAMAPTTTSTAAAPNAAPNAAGTMVSNTIITSDTTWLAADGPFTVQGRVQVAAGATLTIEAGAVVVVQQTIELEGGLTLAGSAATPVRLQADAPIFRGIGEYDEPSRQVRIEHAEIRGPAALTVPNTKYLGLTITDSQLTDIMQSSYLWYPTSLLLERNVFTNVNTLEIGTNHVSAIIRHNRFRSRSYFSGYNGASQIVSWAAYGTPLMVTGNVFEPSIRPRILEVSIDGAIDARSNYFSTTDRSAVDGWVRDKNDDLSLPSTVLLDPVLDAAPLEAPVVEPTRPTPVVGVMGDQQVTVSWSKPSSEGGTPVTGYTVTASPDGQTCTTTGALSCTVTGLTNGTPYSFTAVATNAVGDSPPATSAPVTPAGVPDQPAAPTAVHGDAQAVVSWTAASDNGSPVTGYRVAASPGGHSCTTTGALSCTVTGLTNGTPHGFTVVATNAVGTSPASAWSAPVTPAGVPDQPAAPAAVHGDAQAAVSWAAASDNGSPVTGYTVTASPGGQTCTTTGSLSCTVTGLNNGNPYTFTVVATNAVGDSQPSVASAPITPAAVVTTPTLPPTPVPTSTPGPTSAVPSRVETPKVIVRGRKIVVKWKPASANGSPITRYLIDISKGKDKTAKARARKGVFKGLKPGRYRVRIAARNAIGTSPYSAWVKVRIS